MVGKLRQDRAYILFKFTYSVFYSHFVVPQDLYGPTIFRYFLGLRRRLGKVTVWNRNLSSFYLRLVPGIMCLLPLARGEMLQDQRSEFFVGGKHFFIHTGLDNQFFYRPIFVHRFSLIAPLPFGVALLCHQVAYIPQGENLCKPMPKRSARSYFYPAPESSGDDDLAASVSEGAADFPARHIDNASAQAVVVKR